VSRAPRYNATRRCAVPFELAFFDVSTLPLVRRVLQSANVIGFFVLPTKVMAPT
jgi:hypothetical protein